MIKRITGTIALILLGSLIAVLAVELGVRALPDGILPASTHQLLRDMNARREKRAHYNTHSKLWYVFKPGTKIVVEHPDFKFEIKTNLNLPEAGFRGGTLGGPAWGVAVGDSFTFGFGVNQENSWVALLADEITQDIINLGVPGWGPQQYTRSLERFGIPMKPKVVFYGLHQNDTANGVRFEKRGGRFERFSIRIYLSYNSLLYNFFEKLRRDAKSPSPNIILPQINLRTSTADIKEMLEKENRYFPKGWPIAQREIAKAFNAARTVGAEFVILYFPPKEETYWEQIREKISLPEDSEKHLGKLSKALHELCAARRFLCLDLTPALKARTSGRETLYFEHDGHLNEKGNRVVANEIRRFLSEKGML